MQISSREATPYEGPIPRAIEGLFLEIRWQILFCLAPFQPSQPPFFAQPGHETDRRRVAEDPQPIGGVTADFADERRFKESPGYLPHHRRHHEVYRIALGESTWGLRGSNTKDWSIQRTICANLRHLRLIFSRKEKSNERPHPLRQGKHRQAAEKRPIFRHASCSFPPPS